MWGRFSEKAPRRVEAIMQWFSRSQAGPATENDICAAVGDNSGTSKAIRWLLKQEGGLRRAGIGGLLDPYVYMKWVKWYVDVVVSFLHIPGVLFMFSVLVVGQ
ncbi:uncharacterized protein LOC101776836 [Setaria italica]|uniref:uncharacterized protein LOC101776836 n=1 Tax=Setaria italica TaxID=4555 RepID=UPI000BE5D7A5|nr:uncharacterized protein LOC101776836 [Setaria italica]